VLFDDGLKVRDRVGNTVALRVADPAEEGESALLLGTMLEEGDLIGVLNLPAVIDALRDSA